MMRVYEFFSAPHMQPGDVEEVDLKGCVTPVCDGSLPCGEFRESGTTCEDLLPTYQLLNLCSHQARRVCASGDSMKGAGITHGCLLAVDPERYPNNGDIVVARYDGELTVKYYRNDPQHHRVLLIPDNPEMMPIVVTDLERLEILGVVTSWSSEPQLKSTAELDRMVAEAEHNMLLMNYLRRTTELGYMSDDGEWGQKATNEFKAVWIDAVTARLGIENKWEWATQRWRVPNLRSYYYRAFGSVRYDEYMRVMKKICA